MSVESCLEEHPLLYEDLSDEDQRKKFTVRSRTRNKMKGAVKVMSLWPGYWWSSFRIWCLGAGMFAGMFAATVLVVYNCMALTPGHSHRNSYVNTIEEYKKIVPEPSSPFSEVFMHLFVDNNKEVDLNSYVSTIKTLSNKYQNLTYNLIVVLNDTSLASLSDQENNKIAMNAILSKNAQPLKEVSVMNGINIGRISLTNYMNSSPLKNQWNHLPNQLIKFLVRAISIWDKGGIALNPDILSDSSNTISLKKLNHVLKCFSNKLKTPEASDIIDNRNSYFYYRDSHKRNKTAVANNIRDIINIIEREGNYKNSDDNLLEAENKDHAAVENGWKLLLNTKNNQTIQFSKLARNKQASIDGIISQNTTSRNETSNADVPDILLKNSSTGDSNNTNMLSLFLDFLFHNKNFSYNTSKPLKKITNTSTRRRKSIKKADLTSKSKVLHKNNIDKLRPIVILAKNMEHKDNEIYDSPETSDEECAGLLTVDLKGNIIATENACHAFIGTIFNHAIIPNNNRTLTDFIIAELSTFCKGVISSCKGIDIILA